MATQKKITELQLKSSVLGTESFPLDDTIQSYRVTASQLFDYIRSRLFPESSEVSNLGLATSVSSNALTIALKTKAGNNPSSTDPVRVGFRSATLTSGTYNIREITAATSLVISSGSTLGQASGQPSHIWVYLLDAGSSPELAVSHTKYSESDLISTTAEGGAGAADSATVVYSTTARSNVSMKLIGYILNTQTTAGTWASAGTQIQLLPALRPKQPTKTYLSSGSGTYYPPAGCTRIFVRLVGAGSGGGGSGNSSSGGAGNLGTATTFDVMTGNPGAVGNNSGGGAGGSASGGDLNVSGGAGGGRRFAGVSGGAEGGSCFYFGAMGATAEPNGGGAAGPGGWGCGGGSPGSTATANSGGGGGGGGYSEKNYPTPAASYAYSVGSAGSGGGAGTGGAGGAGATGGLIIVEEFYE